MVARSSVARARIPLYFAAVFFSLATLSQISENRLPRNFPTRRGYSTEPLLYRFLQSAP